MFAIQMLGFVLVPKCVYMSCIINRLHIIEFNYMQMRIVSTYTVYRQGLT